jgi:methyl-accepting chemotaxis protein
MMKTKSLARTFLLRVFLFLFLGQLLLLAWMIYDRTETEQEAVVEKVKTQAILLANAAARSLTDYDFTYLGLLVDEVLKGRETASILIIDKSGAVILERNAGNKATNLHSLRIPITQGSDRLGKIEIWYSLDPVKAQISRQVLTLACLQCLIFLFVAFLVFFYFRRDLGTKLKRISTPIAAVSQGDLTQRIDYNGQDEFGAIANGFDFLLESMATTIGRISAVSQNLALAINRVNETVNETVAAVAEQQASTALVRQTVHDATLSQEQIIGNTRSLVTLSQSNTAAVTEITATFAGIAGSIDKLNMEINTHYSTIAELSRSSRDVAKLADKAASAVQDATQSVQEINASVGNIEQVIQESTDLTAKTTEIISEKGIVAVDNAMTSMAKIQLFVNSLSETITRLHSRSKDIAKILSVIREVTEQAHLLSLNAQIIAGHAGEHGRSFAVVANEMKLLSAKTNSSTKEVEAIIQTIQTEIKAAVKETHETTEIVLHGSNVVAGAESALREILATSHRSASMVKGIKESTSAQNRLVEHILSLITELQVLNSAVKKATDDEELSTTHLVQGISGIRTTMEQTRLATDEQAVSLRVISENIETANQMTAAIVVASQQQLQTNTNIGLAMADGVANGQEMVQAVQDVAIRINNIYGEVEALRNEMDQFKTGNDSKDPSFPAIEVPISH